jgi:hypothetical protein
MKYTVDMGSNETICMPSFTKISSGVQKLLGEGTHTDTDRHTQADSRAIT